MRTIGLVGISGVGKSHMIRSLENICEFQHLQASDLIKKEMARQRGLRTSSEDLRLGEIKDNQKLLVDGFWRAVSREGPLVLFDGHTIIDGAAGVTSIPTSVFRDLGIGMLVFIQAPSDVIVTQRKNDARVRPERNSETIGQHQTVALRAADLIAAELSIPLHVIGRNDAGLLQDLIFAEGRSR